MISLKELKAEYEGMHEYCAANAEEFGLKLDGLILIRNLELAIEALAVVDKFWFPDNNTQACWWCDMGDSGGAELGPGHHDVHCSAAKCHGLLTQIQSEVSCD